MKDQLDSAVHIGGGNCFCKQSLIFVVSSSASVAVAILSLRSVAISEMNIFSGSMTIVLSSSSIM